MARCAQRILVAGAMVACSVCLLAESLHAQGIDFLRQAHAHNDYLHDRPLLDALQQGFASVEADVFLVDGSLLVAHERSTLSTDRSLQALYLDPLRARVQAMGGSVFANSQENPFTLLIDIKSQADDTYLALHALLSQYADLFSYVEDGEVHSGPVTAIVSGNRAVDLIAAEPKRFVGIDGRLSDLGSDQANHLLPLISDNWGQHFSWRGSGEFPAVERDKLARIVEQTHAEHRRIRFWATPDNPAMWAVLRDVGVDLINADDLAGLHQFLSARAAIGETPAFRGPRELLLLESESKIVTLNELSNSVSLIDLTDGRILDELPVGAKPISAAKLSETKFLVSCRDAGSVECIETRSGRLKPVASIHVGYLPMGLAVDSLRKRAFVGLQATGEVAEIDLDQQRVVRRLPVGHWPRFLALSPDGSRLAVGLSGESQIAVLDAVSGETLYQEPLSGGINIGHMQVSADGLNVYFPWMVYRTNPITVRNIQRGWVLASRIARVRLDGPAYREALSLDVPRRAMADPFGLAMTPNEQRIAVTSSGTHELLIYRLGDLPFVGAGGPGDLVDERLLRDDDLFSRIELGGRPMGVVAAADNRSLLVANHTLDCVQVVDLASRQVTRTISLGPQPAEPSQQLVHRGLEIFHDATRSLDQWYSCNSCHLDGGSNAKAMDTWNDGSELTTKTVLPLFGTLETGPWTWHGWQQDFDEALQNSFVSTMQGKPASEEDIRAFKAYLASCQLPPNPFLRDAEVVASAERGQRLFENADVDCASCHSGSRLTDGEIHDVGLNSASDKYDGYNTPSLRGVYQKVRFLHDGRAKSLEDVLTRWHRPDEIGGGAELTQEQLSDLVSYLKTL